MFTALFRRLQVSHSQDFLNGVCTNIMHLTPKKKLKVYKGNYQMYCTTKSRADKLQEASFKAEQEEIAAIKKFISSCGTYANAVKQAQYGTFNLNFHRFDPFELDLRGHTQP